MNRAPADRSGRPFTLVTCAVCRESAGGHALDRLRRTVRACPHGVMVVTGCLGGLLRCRRGSGLHAAVQPCTRDRRPSGGVVRLGPIVTEEDAAAVGAWLAAGMPDDGTLPPALRAAPAPGHVARLN